jgi:hypothetical protein
VTESESGKFSSRTRRFAWIPITVISLFICVWLSVVGLDSRTIEVLRGSLVIVLLGTSAFFMRRMWVRIILGGLAGTLFVAMLAVLGFSVALSEGSYTDNRLISPGGKLVGVTRFSGSEYKWIEVSTRSGWPLRTQIPQCWRFAEGPDHWTWLNPDAIRVVSPDGTVHEVPVTVGEGLVPASSRCPSPKG